MREHEYRFAVVHEFFSELLLIICKIKFYQLCSKSISSINCCAVSSITFDAINFENFQLSLKAAIETFHWKTQWFDFIWYNLFNSIMNETQFFIKCTSDTKLWRALHSHSRIISLIYIYDGCLLIFFKSIELFFVMRCDVCSSWRIFRAICWNLNTLECSGIICSSKIFVQSFISLIHMKIFTHVCA